MFGSSKNATRQANGEHCSAFGGISDLLDYLPPHDE
jgi:hypothetical protein